MNRRMAIGEMIGGLTWGASIIAVALTATMARRLGYIDSELVQRLVIGANGLMIAWYGNRMPKAFVPNASARRARRVGGWSMVISGLIYTLLYAFAPLPLATTGGMIAVVGGIAVTLGYCLTLRAKAA